MDNEGVIMIDYFLKTSDTAKQFINKLVEQSSIRGIDFNKNELDAIFGLYVATEVWGYDGIDIPYFSKNKKDYNNLIKNNLIIHQGKNKVNPTDELIEILQNEKTMKSLIEYLASLSENDLPYNGFYSKFKNEI